MSPNAELGGDISEHSSEESSSSDESTSQISVNSCYSEIIVDEPTADDIVFQDNHPKRRLSHNDIFQFKDLKIEEIKEFHEMLLNEHKDYGMPKLESTTKSFREQIFEYSFIQNLFPTIKDYKPGHDYYMF